MRKSQIIFLIIFIIGAITLISISSYAYFAASVNGVAQANTVQTGTMAITYTDTDAITLNNAIPGDSLVKTFSVKNTGNVDTNYDLCFSELNNTFADQNDLVYNLVSDDGGYSTTSDIQVPSTASKFVLSQKIEAGKTHNYTLTIKFLAKNEAQDDNQGKLFSAKVTVNEFKKYLTNNLAHDLVELEGGTYAINNKSAPDFTKSAPAISAFKDSGFSSTVETGPLTTTMQNYYYTYADSYTIDLETGYYSLVNPKVGKYSDIYASLAGKYTTTAIPLQSSAMDKYNNILMIGLMTETPYSSTSTINIKYRVPNYFYDIYSNAASYDESSNGMWNSSDDYGTSYYYRGAITTNNIIFGGFCWKAMRINGNGTTRLIYNGVSNNGTCSATGNDTEIGKSAFNTNYKDNAYVGYMYGTPGSTTYEATHSNINSSTIKTYIDNWYEENLLKYASKISDTAFCGDRSLNYGTGIGTANTRYGLLNTTSNLLVSFKCPNKNDNYSVSDSIVGNGKLKYPIGLMFLDEAIFAGLHADNLNNHLFYLFSNSDYYLISPSYFYQNSANLAFLSDIGKIDNEYSDTSLGVRPVINLKSDALYSQGDGTSSNPYIIS